MTIHVSDVANPSALGFLAVGVIPVLDISNDVAPVKRLADSFFIVSDTLLYPRYARPFSVVDDFYSRPT